MLIVPLFCFAQKCRVENVGSYGQQATWRHMKNTTAKKPVNAKECPPKGRRDPDECKSSQADNFVHLVYELYYAFLI